MLACTELGSYLLPTSSKKENMVVLKRTLVQHIQNWLLRKQYFFFFPGSTDPMELKRMKKTLLFLGGRDN